MILRKKGRFRAADKAREVSQAFRKLHHQHAVVESAINALEQNVLYICPGHGIDGSKRYVALAVVSRNIKRLGAILRQQAQEQEQRQATLLQKSRV